MWNEDRSVLDVPKEIVLNVTQKHIDKGQRSNPKKCPLALAIVEQTMFNHAEVYCHRVIVAPETCKRDEQPSLKNLLRHYSQDIKTKRFRRAVDDPDSEAFPGQYTITLDY